MFVNQQLILGSFFFFFLLHKLPILTLPPSPLPRAYSRECQRPFNCPRTSPRFKEGYFLWQSLCHSAPRIHLYHGMGSSFSNIYTMYIYDTYVIRALLQFEKKQIFSINPRKLSIFFWVFRTEVWGWGLLIFSAWKRLQIHIKQPRFYCEFDGLAFFEKTHLVDQRHAESCCYDLPSPALQNAPQLWVLIDIVLV